MFVNSSLTSYNFSTYYLCYFKLLNSDQEFAKIGYGDSIDIEYSRAGFNDRRSKSVLTKQPKKIEAQHYVDIKVGCEHCNS